METNYRRSRTGCVNCRAIRAKCDEAKPQCRRCANRGVGCKGYVMTLRWVTEMPTTRTSTRKQSSNNVLRKQQTGINSECLFSTRLHSLRVMPTAHPLDAFDRALFEHWMMMTLQLVCLDPDATHDLRLMYSNLTTKEESVALRAMLSNSAAHLVSLGRIPESTFAVLQQNAFKVLRCSLDNAPVLSMLTDDRISSHVPHMPLPSLDDDTIVGSLLLIDDEIIRPNRHYGAARVQFLLQGTYSLVTERHKYFECACPQPHPGRSEPHYKLDSPFFQSSVRTLAWADIMSCVSCVRPPLLDKRYWLDEAIQSSREGAQKLRPDNDLGYCAQVLSLLGDCTTAIHSLFTQTISEDGFAQVQRLLVRQLDEAMAGLPGFENNSLETPTHHLARVNSPAMVKAHNDCIRAAICHGLATEILLLRTTDRERDSSRIKALCDVLFDSLRQISTGHSVITIMLWPLWVLGCESHLDGSDSSRDFVVMFLLEVYERQGMKNVENCLVALREEVWTLDTPTPDRECDKPPEQQSAWVWHCWNRGIRLLLA